MVGVTLTMPWRSGPPNRLPQLDDPYESRGPVPRTPGQIVVRGRVVTPSQLLEDGLVVAREGLIAWVGPTQDAPPDVTVPAHDDAMTVLPGLVDLHCHGGGGASFPGALDAETARTAVQEHQRHGTTTLVASLVTAAAESLLERTALLADLADAGEVAGIHLEGPFLSPRRCGAQDPSFMRPGDPELVGTLVAAARGHLVTMTIAPEVAGVLGVDGVIALLAEQGVIPSIGHTDGSAEVTERGLAQAWQALRGPGHRSRRPTVTHLFNGMPPLHHREPGPVPACLAAAARGEAVVELVGDGVHLAGATVRAVFDLVGAQGIALVSDAIAAAGMPDGAYQLGALAVRVEDGVARSAEDGAIAGGTAHLLDVVRWTVGVGVSLVDAIRSAATTPAKVLGRPDVGALIAGRRADLVLVDAALSPIAVLRRGRWTTDPSVPDQDDPRRSEPVR